MHMTDFNEPESEALFVLLGLKLDVSGIQIAFKPFSLEMFMLLFLSEYFNIIFRDWALCMSTNSDHLTYQQFANEMFGNITIYLLAVL